MGRHYGQFCGLARAAEVVGERWTLLILRDLSVGEARFTELKAGLPGIAATMLTARLRELEESGLVTRREDRSATTYALSDSGRSVLPALRALSLWGASTMPQVREGEIVTDRSLAAMLATTRTGARVTPFTVEVQAPNAAANAAVAANSVEVRAGRSEQADLTLSGPGLRTLLARPDCAEELLASGELTVAGRPGLLARFTDAFHAPLTT